MNSPTDLNRINQQPSISSFVKKHALRTAISGVLGIGASLGFTSTLPKQWPATLLFQVGQVGASQIVDPNSVVQRVKFPGFALQVLQSQNLPLDASESERTGLIKSSLSASLAKGGNLIEMSVKGYSREEATENLKAAFKVLENEHAQLLTPSITRLKNNLDDTIQSLKKIEDERQAILDPINKAKNSNSIEKKFSESILLTSMIRANDAETRGLRDQKNAIEEQLSPYRTFNTKMVTSIYTPRKPTSPNKILAAILGLMLGVLVASVWAIIRDKELRSLLKSLHPTAG